MGDEKYTFEQNKTEQKERKQDKTKQNRRGPF